MWLDDKSGPGLQGDDGMRSITRGRPAHERTGPTLSPIDPDLDFDVKNHHDQQREHKRRGHLRRILPLILEESVERKLP